MKTVRYHATLSNLDGEIEVDDRMTHDEIILAILENILEIHYYKE